MKANELMIGDWVMSTHPAVPRPIRVKEIYDRNVGYKNGVLHMSFIEPIPLTPDILEKNGFVANNHVYRYPYYEYIDKKLKLKIGFAFPQGNRTSYKDPWVYIDSEYVFVEHLPCIYVHQLQHAFRLCGIKKEIEL